jgi:hypothetical protein
MPRRTVLHDRVRLAGLKIEAQEWCVRVQAVFVQR